MENNKTKDLLIFKNENNIFTDNSTLQASFKNFLKNRKDLRNSTNKEIKFTTFRDNKERMAELREKFIQKAISYLGVPYGKKYLTEDHPNYNSELFLDCCGLIRQCINDLKDEFGFMLGRWNQGYQFDTLPEILEFNQMKRGDLIFYTGTFYPEKKVLIINPSVESSTA
jgi:hypothetical protein